MSAPRDNLTRACEVLSVHDGDTVRVRIAHGISGIESRILLRLAGLNARELGDPGGREARDNLAGFCSPGVGYVVAALAPDKYAGRIDGVLWHPARAEASVNAVLVADGWAAPWNGTGTKPLPVWPMDGQRGDEPTELPAEWNLEWERPGSDPRMVALPDDEEPTDGG